MQKASSENGLVMCSRKTSASAKSANEENDKKSAKQPGEEPYELLLCMQHALQDAIKDTWEVNAKDM